MESTNNNVIKGLISGILEQQRRHLLERQKNQNSDSHSSSDNTKQVIQSSTDESVKKDSNS